MPVVFTIAWRNIFRHKGKTLIIGTILFLGSLIMTIGNGIISGLDKGLENNIVKSFTGEILLISEEQLSDSILLSSTGQTAEPINNYLEIEKVLKGVSFIDSFLPGGIGYVWVLNESGQPIDQYILGIDFNKYYNFFDRSMEVLEGRFMEPGEKGVLVSTTMRKWLYDFCGYWPVPKGTELVEENLNDKARLDKDNLDLREELVYMGLSRKNSTLDVLCEVKGIIRFKALNSLLGFYSLVDIESFRECMGYFTAQDAESNISNEYHNLLSLEDEKISNIFDEQLSEIDNNETINFDQSLFKRKEKVKKTLDLDAGVYNMVYIKLKPDQDIKDALNKLNILLKDNNLAVRAVPWNKAVGMLGQIAMIMKGALFLFVAFIFFVAVIIIMNTLSMAAMERVSEIGMMRAVGAGKWFVSRMFLAETFVQSATFGGLGIFVGIVVINILASLKLTTKNEILQIFYGGDIFHPVLDSGDIFLCIIQLAFVTFIAVIYPIIVARRISALDAIARD
ncbi:MAG: ABC transporter permease [bacterium]|nr:ABC transporter permease [bacterium]